MKKFDWQIKIKDAYVWFHLHLETEEYYSERDICDSDIECNSDWGHPAAWGNYHRCKLSSNAWHDGGFKVCPIDEYDHNFLNNFVAKIDHSPEQYDDYEGNAFHIYLLGHDAVAYHTIKFTQKNGTDFFDIIWDGKIALTYVGEYDFKHDFHAEIYNVKLPSLKAFG